MSGLKFVQLLHKMKTKPVLMSLSVWVAVSFILTVHRLFFCSVSDENEPLSWNSAANVTVVTAVYDLGRIDRVFNETYAKWIRATISAVDAPFVVFCHKKHAPILPVSESVHVMVRNRLPLQAYQPKIQSIAASQHANRSVYIPELMNEEYLVLVYSKFMWLQTAISLNKFNTTHFFWADAGLSRFLDGPVTAFTPRFLHPSKIVIEQYYYDRALPCLREKDIVLGTRNAWLAGGYFGGNSLQVWKLRGLRCLTKTSNVIVRSAGLEAQQDGTLRFLP